MKSFGLFRWSLLGSLLVLLSFVSTALAYTWAEAWAMGAQAEAAGNAASIVGEGAYSHQMHAEQAMEDAEEEIEESECSTCDLTLAAAYWNTGNIDYGEAEDNWVDASAFEYAVVVYLNNGGDNPDTVYTLFELARDHYNAAASDWVDASSNYIACSHQCSIIMEHDHD